MPGKILPLFAVEEQDGENWRLLELRRGLFHDLVDELTWSDCEDEYLPRRARRVKTLEEAETLNETLGCKLWARIGFREIAWVPIKEQP